MKVTVRDLEILCMNINIATKHEQKPVTKLDDGTIRWNLGTYMLDNAYGGWKLVQIVGDGGSVRDVTIGYAPKKDCYYQMRAFLMGVDHDR